MNAGTRLPVYLQVYKDLKREILCGRLQPDSMLPFETDLARKYSITRISVRKAIDKLKEEGLIFKIRGKGSFVSSGASSPQSASKANLKSCLFCQADFVVGGASDPYYHGILLGAEREARQNNVSLSFKVCGKSTYDSDIEYLKNLERVSEIAGIMLVGWSDRYFMERAVEFNLPIVCVNFKMALLRMSNVTADNFGGARQGMRRLLDMGHRDIVVIASSSGVRDPNHRERIRGCEEAFKEAGIEGYERNFIFCDFDESQSRQMTLSMLKGRRESPPSAIFALSDRMCNGAFRAVKESGLAIPNDISVLAFDGVNTEASSMMVPVEEIGAASLKTLLRLGANRRELIEKVIPVSFIDRGSLRRQDAGRASRDL